MYYRNPRACSDDARWPTIPWSFSRLNSKQNLCHMHILATVYDNKCIGIMFMLGISVCRYWLSLYRPLYTYTYPIVNNHSVLVTWLPFVFSLIEYGNRLERLSSIYSKVIWLASATMHRKPTVTLTDSCWHNNQPIASTIGIIKH